MKRILLMRHCESKANTDLGYTLDDLTPAGEEQAKALSRTLNPYIYYIVSSPNERASRSARIISKERKIPIFLDERWKEIDRGIYTKRPYSEFVAEWAKNGNSFDYIPEGGESINQGRTRMIKGFKELVSARQNILCVTHLGLISNLLMMLYSFEFERGKPKCGEICELLTDGNEVILEPSKHNSFLGISNQQKSGLNRLNLSMPVY